MTHDNPRILAQRTYSRDQEVFTVGITAPYREGNDWYCEVFVEPGDDDPISVGGVDELQAIRLAFPILDAVVESRPGARSRGIVGPF